MQAIRKWLLVAAGDDVEGLPPCGTPVMYRLHLAASPVQECAVCRAGHAARNTQRKARRAGRKDAAAVLVAA